MRSALSALHEELAQLKVQIDWLKKRLFGPGQGERLDRAQLLLQLEELEKLAERVSAPTQLITYERAKPASAARKAGGEIFTKLPVKETIEIVPEAVQQQPELYEQIGEERTFEVDVVPPQLFKREIVRPKYQRRTDKSLPPVVAPAPARLAPGGYVSAGLLAFVLTAKYVDHLPLYLRWLIMVSEPSSAIDPVTVSYISDIFKSCPIYLKLPS